MSTKNEPKEPMSGMTGKPEKSGTLNGIDLNSVRLSTNYEEAAGVERLLLTVPVKKPERTEFFRVHPDPEYRINVGVIEIKEVNEEYLVAGHLTAQLPDEIIPKTIHTCVNRQGTVFLWPVRLPGPDGRLDSWNKSKAEIAERATKNWMRMVANQSLRGYDVHVGRAIPTEPRWPDKTFPELLQIAFKDHYIQSEDHPVLRQLRGEV